MSFTLSPYFYQQFSDANGAPLSGGKIYSYQAGTSTPQATYTDSSGGTPNANPVILDSSGSASIWLDPALSYKFVLKDSGDNLIKTIDGIVGLLTNDSVATASIQDGAVTTAKLAAGAVTGAKLASDASVDANRPVNTNNIKDGAITTAKIADANVTNAKLAADVTLALIPPGTLWPYAGRSAPSGWLLAYGQNVSRAAYSALYSAIAPVLGAVTVTIASPAVFTLSSHGLSVGDRIRLSTTGALPTGLAASTDYFVSAVPSSSTFRVSATLGGSDVNTSGSQSGVHTAQYFPYGAGDGSTTFGLPDLRGRAFIGADAMGGTAASRITSGNSGIYGGAIGAAGGDERLHQHTHSVTDPGHTHSGVLVSGSANVGVGSDTAVQNGSTASATTGITIANAGSGAAQNVQPSLVGSYIIKT